MAKILITTIQMNLVPNPSEEAIHIHLNVTGSAKTGHNRIFSEFLLIEYL